MSAYGSGGGALRKPGVWWRGKSTPAKVETYTRWSFHFLALLEIASIGLPAFGQLGSRFGSLTLVAVCVHGACCALTASRALDWTRGIRDQPVRLLWALGAVTALITVGAAVLTEHGSGSDDAESAAAVLSVLVPAFGVGIIALGIRDWRRASVMVVGSAVGVGGVVLLVGVPAPAALGAAGAEFLAAGFIVATSALSVWLLNTVYALDEARETRTRLAVAEERLRFGRDLHDVMGRNLAVIALKSELAVQLARRGRPEAVEQMIEVQRIAQESQREVREVVRGYREADLATELAGAQGVLTAAGIDCEVSGPVTGLPAQVQAALGWVVREAATNVLRHGDAGRCSVSLRVTEGRGDGGRVTLTVENDGVPGEARDGESGGESGSGLVGLRERLMEVGGVLRAGAVGDGVFRLVAEVPLPVVSVAGAAPGPGPGGGQGLVPAPAPASAPASAREVAS